MAVENALLVDRIKLDHGLCKGVRFRISDKLAHGHFILFHSVAAVTQGLFFMFGHASPRRQLRATTRTGPVFEYGLPDLVNVPAVIHAR
jgi:hypothetical protein